MAGAAAPLVGPSWSDVFGWVTHASPRALVYLRTAVEGVASARANTVEVDGWDPWLELLGRPGVRFQWLRMGGALNGLILEDAAGFRIVMDPDLPAAQRARTLTHELVHLERLEAGDAPVPPWTPAERRAEEAEVDRITGERMAGWVGAGREGRRFREPAREEDMTPALSREDIEAFLATLAATA